MYGKGGIQTRICKYDMASHLCHSVEIEIQGKDEEKDTDLSTLYLNDFPGFWPLPTVSESARSESL